MRVCTSCRRLLRSDATRCPADGAAIDVVDVLPNGARLGGYRIERLIGEGGMGFVYEATHEVIHRRSAIKMLRPELATHEQVVTRFLNEAKAVNLIDHQNIVNVYDYGDSRDGNVYFVMEFLEGETLDDLMRKRRALHLPLLLHLFGQIAKALAAAHAKRIVHRDLKPANVYVVAREHDPYFVKLLDFGIAQLRGDGAASGSTVIGAVMGTPQYMSPEQISGGAVDARSDVWAAGVMLYRAATGQAPFKEERFAALADQILHHAPPPAGEIAALPAALTTLIAHCLERRIEDRCQSAEQLIAGLERVKRECKLDDDAIAMALRDDTGVSAEARPAVRQDRTRDSVAGSLPRYQGAGSQQRAPRAQDGRSPRRSRLGTYVVVAAVTGALAAASLVIVRGKARPVAVIVRDPGARPATGSATAKRSIKDAYAAGDVAGGRALAEQDLRSAIASGTRQQQGFAVDALAHVRAPATAPLLYAALKAPPDVRVKAARALGELGLPDSAPKLRDALAASSEPIKLELAAALYRLGDKDARDILKRATEAPTTQLTAAIAMAEVADDLGRAVLADTLKVMPPGSDPWRRAAGGLMKLGDGNARKLLEGELVQRDATRSIGAAALLARAGDARARDYLARVTADDDPTRPGAAAVALAQIGDRRALGWVAEGLASGDVGERTRALAICGILAADAAAHTGAIATIATDDPDATVRMTAEAVLIAL